MVIWEEQKHSPGSSKGKAVNTSTHSPSYVFIVKLIIFIMCCETIVTSFPPHHARRAYQDAYSLSYLAIHSRANYIHLAFRNP